MEKAKKKSKHAKDSWLSQKATSPVASPKSTRKSRVAGDGIVRMPRIISANLIDLRQATPEPVAFAMPERTELTRHSRKGVAFSIRKSFSRVSQLTALALLIVIAGSSAVSAYEAHMVNVIAEIRQIDPPVLDPPGSGLAWDNTSGGTGLVGTVDVVMTDNDPDATHIFYTFGDGTDPVVIPAPVCGQTGLGGGGGQIPIEIVPLSLVSDTVIKAIACDGDTGAAHRSVTNTKIYDFLELDDPVADQYSPIADAYVDQSHPTVNHANGNPLEVVSKHDGANARGYIRFDFQFPVGTTINSSSLNLFMVNAPSGSRTYQVRKGVSPTWSETGLTWDNQPCGTDLSDCSAITSTATSGTTNSVWLLWDVRNDVQSFATDSTVNFGWELNDASEEAGGSGFTAKFTSREATGANESKRPYLQVNFTAPSATTNHLVVNEVYPVVGSGKGTEADNEWVEIYNPTASSVDISGWQICDNNGCDDIAGGMPAVPSHGFALIANATTTWASFWPGAPAAAVKIGLGDPIGNGLANGGDRVILRDGTVAHDIVDAMSYGNDTTYITLPAPKAGISLARIVKGYDTDTATDWVLNNTPNPGTNPSVNGTEVMRFTSDGIEVAATEGDLPPVPGSGDADAPQTQDTGSVSTSTSADTTSTASSNSSNGTVLLDTTAAADTSIATSDAGSNTPTTSETTDTQSNAADTTGLSTEDTSAANGTSEMPADTTVPTDSSTPTDTASDPKEDQAIASKPDDQPAVIQDAPNSAGGDASPPPLSNADDSGTAAPAPADAESGL